MCAPKLSRTKRIHDTYLVALAREVVCSLDDTLDTRVDIGISSVVGTVNGVRPARAVRETQVDLAVLALLVDANIGTDRSSEIFTEVC